MSTTATSHICIASFALLIAPGPTVLYIITQAASHGRKAGFMCVLGGVTGMLVLTGLVAVGLAGLLAASPIAFNIVKWFGAAYLIYVGIRTLLDRNAIRFDRSAERPACPIVFAGLITAVLNPKLAIFFAAFLPQFVDPNGGSVALQIVLLGLIFRCDRADIGLAAMRCWPARRATGLRRQPAAIKALRWVSGQTSLSGWAARWPSWSNVKP